MVLRTEIFITFCNLVTEKIEYVTKLDFLLYKYVLTRFDY